MPLRVLEWQTLCEMLKGDNEGIIPLKVFRCVYFVKDNKPTVGKLDSRAVKCLSGLFGYSEGICLLESSRELFVSMNVTFRELEPYFSNVTSPFDDSPDTGGMR